MKQNSRLIIKITSEAELSDVKQSCRLRSRDVAFDYAREAELSLAKQSCRFSEAELSGMILIIIIMCLFP